MAKTKRMASGPLAGSWEAKRKANALLTVWAEGASPKAVMEELKVSPMTWYAMSYRAQQAMVNAMEPQARGPAGPTVPEKRVEELEKENRRLRRDLNRTVAQTQMLRRSMKLNLETPERKTKKGKTTKGSRGRRRLLLQREVDKMEEPAGKGEPVGKAVAE